ncbi:MAG TPA: hypothetical protein VGO52_20355 [Hyphomonadaceae bacterium]|jgi:hypothetical protein|nr:hypothetical protein [Hyphomonadaceae bacterium]
MGMPSAAALDSESTFTLRGMTLRVFSAWAVVVWFGVGVILNMLWTWFANGWVIGLVPYLTHFVWGVGLVALLVIESFEKLRGTRPLLLVMVLLLFAFPFATRPFQLAGDWLGFMAAKPGYDRITQAGQRGELDLRGTRLNGVEYQAVQTPYFLAAFHIYRGVPDSGAAIVFDPKETLANLDAPESAAVRGALPDLLGGDGVKCIRYAHSYFRCSYS